MSNIESAETLFYFKTCPHCKSSNKIRSKFCSQCRFEFLEHEKAHDDLTAHEEKDVQEFYSDRENNTQKSNVQKLIDDLND